MDRRKFMESTAGALVSLTLPQNKAGAVAVGKRQPNVLFILPDEWRAQALGCMGNVDVQTPHLDRLASEGTLFRNTLANTPVCCPARANILTGTYANRNGMVANDLRFKKDVSTVADLFGKAGYKTGYIGKWHLDGGPRYPGFVPPGPRRHGFQYWAANECNHNYFYNWYFRDENVPIVSELYEPEFWTNLAIDFLHESHDRPFFLMLAPGAPHDPYLAPEEYMNRYNPAKLTMRPNWVEGVHESGRKDVAAYYASITAIDDQIGRLLRVLQELGLDENTIVLFSSDHGNMLGSQGAQLKRKPWEESIRVPGIVRCPKTIPAGRVIDTLFSHVDFAPTLLSLCGLPIPKQMQGSDLSEVVLGKSTTGPASAYFQIFGPYHGDGTEFAWRAIRTERYLYARTETGPWLLYDLEKDPYEMRNLVNDDGSGSILRELDAKLLENLKQVGDAWSFDWTGAVEEGGLYNYRAFETVQAFRAWARQNPHLAAMGK
jgi:arylsulfatase A-like enzyme